ncbi:glycoside hydrolase family 65 protein [Alkalibacterium sp. f15]|uniref:glycoside hydrolase family 65 protein n=1 Tax=Alkalibacterium sp. f15 TaxID=3414029 RepID=UPI003BF78C82
MMKYDYGNGENENWIVAEEVFSTKYLGKVESILSLGNGYMGLRSVTEESYLNEQRNLLVNGTFNNFSEEEVPELPNIADVTNIDFKIDGERFSLEFGETKKYIRYLNLKEAELVREIDWVSPDQKQLSFKFRRFVSLEDLHLIGLQIEVTNNGEQVDISFESGIDAQLTNTGSQHFHEGEKRIYDKKFLETIQTTTESNIDIVVLTAHDLKVNNESLFIEPKMEIARRKMTVNYDLTLNQGDSLVIDKTSMVYTSRDNEWEGESYSLSEMRKVALSNLKANSEKGYDTNFNEHKKAWETKVWNAYNFRLKTDRSFDLLASRFAIYHLMVMVPAHSDKMGIGAKALSGEGYRGHSFWDTEIFILPFFTFFNPEIAKSLLKYRYHGLIGAKQKALDNDYQGAMYPWEAAYPSDGEVTPVWGAVDIVTGEQTKIWSGFIEQHITADIAFAVYQYYSATGDEAFMNQYGYEIIFETAKFWSSRLEWNDEKDQYEINGVIGPDEYKEHVNNNAFTNYMAHFNLSLAIEYHDSLQANNEELLGELDERTSISAAMNDLKTAKEKLYLPKPDKESLVIPQDDTYLLKKEIDLSKYKNADTVGKLFDDYNLDQVNQMQVSKQADVLVLLYLMDQTHHEMSKELKQANFDYYEPRTTHDSSLSLSTHAIIASDIKNKTLAYDLYSKAIQIDLGPNMLSSDPGVHAASIGGIWQIILFGFAGVRVKNTKLTINPSLPEEWDELGFVFQWQNKAVQVDITKSDFTVTPLDDQQITFECEGKTYTSTEAITI